MIVDDEASREFARFAETGVSIMPPGKEVRTTFIFGAVKGTSHPPSYEVNIECLDIHGEKITSPTYSVGIEELRLITAINNVEVRPRLKR